MGFLQWLGLRPATTTQTGVLSPLIESSHLSSVTWAHLLGLDTDHSPVSRGEAMSIPAMARARNIITGQAGRLSWTAVRNATPLPAGVTPILDQPERGRPRSLTMSWIVDGLFWFGRAWLIVTERYADGGRPMHVQWVPEYLISHDGVGNVLVDNRPVHQADVIRIDGPHEGVLNFGREPLRAARALARSAGRAADNPVPSIDLHQTSGEPLRDADIDKLTARWIKARRSGNGAVGYTSPNIEAKPLGQPPEQLLVEGRKAAALECAQLANLPAWAVDAESGGSSLTYSNVPSRARELLDVTLAPYLDAIAGRLSLDDVLPRGTWCRADTQALTNPDFAERMAGYQAAITAGIYTQQECRAMELGTASAAPAAELEPTE